MKTHNALSKSFTDEVKIIMGGGKSIDEAFEDIKITQLTNGHEYVDLGLPSGIMWATCNVGADKPEDKGLLFQFGRVDGYAYNDENHQFRTMEQNTQDTGDEYIPLTASGRAYNEGETLDLADDAAHINMGGAWRMPTGSYNESTEQYEGELGELFDNTTYEVTTINEVQGMMFTSNINGKQLFIPFAGYWNEDDGGFFAAGSIAYVWSSRVHPSDVDGACRLSCDSSGYADISGSSRSYAFSVRGVFQV